MRIALFGYEHHEMTKLAQRGLQSLGHEIIGQSPCSFRPEQGLRGLDGVVVTSLAGTRREVVRHYAAQGVTVCLIDLPHLARGCSQWRISPPDLQFLPEFEGEVPAHRLDQLGLNTEKPRTRKKAQTVVVVGQRGGDPTHGMSSTEFRAWATAAIETVHRLCDSKVIWRPHPKDVYEIDTADEFSDPRTQTLSEAFENAWLVVAYNSTAGLDALIAGIPVVTEGPSVYNEITHTFREFSKIGPVDEKERERVLRKIAHTQWSDDEIDSGEALAVFYPPEGKAKEALERLVAAKEAARKATTPPKASKVPDPEPDPEPEPSAPEDAPAEEAAKAEDQAKDPVPAPEPKPKAPAKKAAAKAPRKTRSKKKTD